MGDRVNDDRISYLRALLNAIPATIFVMDDRGPHCKDCVIRNSVTDSLSGRRVTRRRTRVTLVLGADRKELDLLITASPLPQAAEPLSLLILEDISDMRGAIGEE